MAIRLDQTYRQLSSIVLAARRLLWSSGDEYTGPTSPLGLLVQLDCRVHSLTYWFVLAECVAPKDLSSAWDEESPGGIVLVRLREDFTFAQWDLASGILGGITAVCSSDGSAAAYEVELASNPNAKVSFSRIYSPDQHSGVTHLVAPKQLLLGLLPGRS